MWHPWSLYKQVTHHLSGPHSNTPNPQTGMCHYHLGHYLHMPHQFAHQRQYPPTYPVNTCLPLNSALKPPAPTPVGIFKMFQHPHSISPTKSNNSKKIPINSEIFQKNTQQPHHTCGNILQPEQGIDESPPTQTPASVCILETVQHLHRIGPNKPVIRVPWTEMATSDHPALLGQAVVKSTPLSHPTLSVQHCHRQLECEHG